MRRIARLFRLTGAAGSIVGCTAMVSMLPGLAASVLGAVGVTGSGVLAQTLNPISEPLFVTSAVLFTLGGLCCGWLATLSAIAGSGLLYLSMFVLASTTSMAGMTPGRSAGHAQPAVFWIGAALMITSAIVTTYRRRHHMCRPLLRRLA